MNNLRVSIVIPVYNEAERIHECLTAIAVQTVQPYEVIVVNNNSTDETVAIARSFPFVTIIDESRQGVVFARDRGFNAAHGEIIGRIDADTMIAANWVETLQMLFKNDRLSAVSGSMTYRNILMPKLVASVDLFWRRRMARLLGREVAIQACNMALSKRAWLRVAGNVCHRSNLHEDFDLAIHLVDAGEVVRFDERLQASICYRQANADYFDFAEYTWLAPKSYLDHGRDSGKHMYQLVWFVMSLYPFISLLSRGYDTKNQRFSLLQLFRKPLDQRVNPATHVE